MMQRTLPGGRVALPLDAPSIRQPALSPTHTAHNAARSAPCPWHASSRFCCQAVQSAEVASTSGRQSHIRFEDLIETPGLREPSPNGALQPEDHNNFVRFFRMASPYVEGHRGRIFVIVLPGEVNPSWHSVIISAVCATTWQLMTLQMIQICVTPQQRDASVHQKLFTSQVFLKQDLLENFLEDVSVLHGRSGGLIEDALIARMQTNFRDLQLEVLRVAQKQEYCQGVPLLITRPETMCKTPHPSEQWKYMRW